MFKRDPMTTLDLEDSRKSFNRINGKLGLVDITDYSQYLIDNPDDVPLNPSGMGSDPLRFVKQHAYYEETHFRQFDLEYEQRDPRLVALRVLSYSQIVMRSRMEQRLHNEKERRVERPSVEMADKAVRDYFELDLVAAAALGIHEIAINRQPNYGKYVIQPPPEITRLSTKDRRAILKKQWEKSLEALEHPLVVPQILVASALKRLARHTGNAELMRQADQRLEGDGYIPLEVPKLVQLRSVGYAILKDAVGIHPLEKSRIGLQGLQKNPKIVQMAA